LKSPIFDQMMAHLRKVLNDRNVNISSTDIAASVGIHMLRAVEDDAGFDSQTFESQARIRTFEKILTRYIAGKEESERFFASANTANRRSSSLNVPLAITEAPTAARVMQKTPEPSPSAPAAAVLNLGTIQERSVKVIFSDPDSKPSQDELRTLLSRYGVVSNVRTVPSLLLHLTVLNHHLGVYAMFARCGSNLAVILYLMTHRWATRKSWRWCCSPQKRKHRRARGTRMERVWVRTSRYAHYIYLIVLAMQ
jgi:hypothetical protein